MNYDDEIVLEAFAMSATPISDDELIDALARLRHERNLDANEIPLNLSRARAIDYLRTAGLVERKEAGWVITDSGRTEVERIKRDREWQIDALEAFMQGDH